MNRLMINIAISISVLSLQAMQQGQQEAEKQSLAEFLKSFNKGKITKENYYYPVGNVKDYSDGSTRIENYLEQIGRTLYWDGINNNYLEIGPAGNIILDSRDAQLVREWRDQDLGEHRIYRHPQEIEVYSGNIFTITYPTGLKVVRGSEERAPRYGSRDYRSGRSGYVYVTIWEVTDDIFSDRTASMKKVFELHSAIDKLDEYAVRNIINTRSYNDTSKIVSYLLHGETPLTRVVKKAMKSTGEDLSKALNIIGYLMGAGADISVQNSQGNTPIQLAVGNTVVLETLSDNRLKQLLSAHLSGDVDAAKKIVSFFAPVLQLNINRFDSARVRKLLSTISKAGNTKQILKDLVNAKVFGDTALHTAVKIGIQVAGQQFEAIQEIIQMLLGAGADPSITDNQGNTAIVLAAAKPDLLKLFVQASGRALFDAITRADMATADKLLDEMQKRGNRAQIVNSMTNDEGQTPLVYAYMLALGTTDKVRFGRILQVAQSLINKGATLVNPAGQAFLEHHGDAYRARILPLVSVPRLPLSQVTEAPSGSY